MKVTFTPIGPKPVRTADMPDGVAYEEEWRAIEGYGGNYYASNMGRIKGYRGIRNIKYTDRYGYLATTVSYLGKQKTRRVHRLVAMAWIPNPHGKPMVNHINGIKSDNRACNLEWATAEENISHSFRNGFHNETGENNNSAKLTASQVADIFCVWHSGNRPPSSRLASTYGVSVSTIENIVYRKKWRSVTDKLPQPYIMEVQR